MEKMRTGGCACKAVRYEISGPSEFAFHCQCRKCQRSTGGGHSSAFAVAKANIRLIGDVREYAQGSDNGATTFSGFCPSCGSPVSSRTERFPDRIYIHAATLDDPASFEPQFIVFSSEAQKWDHMDPSLEDVSAQSG
ncbi:MAG: GFA family protein [Sneathiella sp.]